MSSSSALENLETQLEMFIENVRQVGIIVADFQPQGHQVLNQKIQSMVTGLQEIDKIKPQVQDVHVPFEVFDYIDQGKNPQLYTKDCIEKALAKNEEVKGKIDAYRKFKMNMMMELHKTFPNEIDKYRVLRKPHNHNNDNDNDVEMDPADVDGASPEADAEVDD